MNASDDPTEPAAPGRLHDLSTDECWSLAASQQVGRLAWTGSHGPMVIPVNFTVDGSQIRIRTAAYSIIARECDDSPVAFEIDDLDATSHRGWSVLMRGTAHLEYGAGSPAANDPQTWAAGAKALRVVVDVDEVTGRRVQ